MYELGTGFAFNISAESIGSKESFNDLYLLSAQQIPYEAIKNIQVTIATDTKKTYSASILQTQKKSPMWYSAQVQVTEEQGIVSFNQTFSNGWVLFCSQNKHIKANNWANAWILPQENHHIYVIFIPQILEWFGFVTLGLCLIIIMRK